MSMLYALIALCLCGSTLAQVITSGSCPDVQVEENFDISQIIGRWYEQTRYYTLFEAGTECSIYDYSAEANNTHKVVSIANSVVTGKVQVVQSEILTPDPEQKAKMLIKIPMSPIEEHNNLWVLGIDDKAWAVFLSCNTVCSKNLQYAWILTKQQNPDESVMKKAYKVAEKNNLDRVRFMKVNQQGCTMAV